MSGHLRAGVLLGLAAVLGLGVALPAQTFRSGADAVMVDVLVTRGGQPVTGLTTEDFTLFDNDVPQQIDAVLLEEVPITLLLVLDISGSVGGRGLDRLRAAALAAGAALRPDDRVGLLTFSDRVRLRVEPPATATQLPEAVGRLRAGGATALYDATFAALALREQTLGRIVMLVFSDGDDTASWLEPLAVLDSAQRSDTVVYAVTLDKESDNFRDRQRRALAHEWFPIEPDLFRHQYLSWLVEYTGGSIFVEDDFDRLPAVFEQVVNEFRNRYVLAYAPTGVEFGGWHDLDVRVTGRGRRAQARRGYLR
jgi:VWFA-related protein